MSPLYAQHTDFRSFSSEDFETFLSSRRFIYRVFDNDSATKYSESDGFVASFYQHRSTYQLEHLSGSLRDNINSIISHLRWGYRGLSPWISTTSEWAWAVWELNARQFRPRRGPNPRVAVIDTSLIPSRRTNATPQGWEKTAFYALDLLKEHTWAKEEIDFKLYANSAAEVLCHAWIPAQAIVRVFSIEEVLSQLPDQMFEVCPAGNGRLHIPWPEKISFSTASYTSGLRLKSQIKHNTTNNARWELAFGRSCAKLACFFLAPLIETYTGLAAETPQTNRVQFLDGCAHSVRHRVDEHTQCAAENLLDRIDRLMGVLVRTRAIVQPVARRAVSDTTIFSGGTVTASPYEQAFTQLLIHQQFNDIVRESAQVPVQNIEPTGEIADLIARFECLTLDDPNPVALRARNELVALHKTLRNLSSIIARWLVKGYSNGEWTKIKEGIEVGLQDSVPAFAMLLAEPASASMELMTSEARGWITGEYVESRLIEQSLYL